jgi:ferredoxin-NADP reductase/MOSC domain-containing protein YiiM/ferredoxin
MTAGRLLSLNVGVPRDIEWDGRSVRTAVYKDAVEGRRMARRLNVDGDDQGDKAGHGGPNRAVFVYQLDCYRYWEQELGRDDFIYGQFGENFTVEGLADDEVCIGDRYRIGGALFEVSAPRVTCFRVGIRMNDPRIPSLLVAHRRPGFYFRVLEEGEVGAGDTIERVSRGPEAMTVTEVDGLLYLPGHARRDLERALRIPALSVGWQGSFRDMLSADAPAAPAWPGLRPLRVTAIARESTSVISVRLAPVDGEPAPAAQPGQFLTVRLSSGLLRTYSLSDTEPYRISVKREPHGAVSGYLHDKLRVGDVLEAGAPRGSFVLRAGERPVVLISAGVGATPVLAMLHALAAEHSPRPVWWIHGARNAAEHAFAAEAHDLLATLPDAHEVIRYSETSGRLSDDVLADVPVDADCYLCGPAPFMQTFAAALAARGTEHVSMEIFGPLDALTPGIAAVKHVPHPPPGPAGGGPDIAFARSNLTAPWDPSFASLLEFAEACDVPVRWSCRTGVCHECETGLIGGDVSYQPDPLEPPGPGAALLCCSTPRGAVTLDL